VLGIQSANLIAYWPLNETSGTNAVNMEGTAARDAPYNSDVSTWPVATGIGDGGTAPTYDGTNDSVNIYSASLDGVFDGSEFTISLWFKVSAVGVWTDGANRTAILIGTDTPGNVIEFEKSAVGNRLDFEYTAGSTTKLVSRGSTTSTDWIHLAMTVSAGADEMKAYYNGSQTGATQTTLGTWADALKTTSCAIGSAGGVPAEVTNGYIAHVAIWDSALIAATIAELATV
jgi:hypothetical protein